MIRVAVVDEHDQVVSILDLAFEGIHKARVDAETLAEVLADMEAEADED